MIWYCSFFRGTDNSKNYEDTYLLTDATPAEIRSKSIHLAQFPSQTPSELHELLPEIDT